MSPLPYLTLDPLQFAYHLNRFTGDAIAITLPYPIWRKWVLDLTGCHQVVKVGSIPTPLILNTGAPKGCFLSPLLYYLVTHDCVAMHASNSIIKFAHNTKVVLPTIARWPTGR
jgi:hypothetical protein